MALLIPAAYLGELCALGVNFFLQPAHLCNLVKSRELAWKTDSQGAETADNLSLFYPEDLKY